MKIVWAGVVLMVAALLVSLGADIAYSTIGLRDIKNWDESCGFTWLIGASLIGFGLFKKVGT